MKTSKWPGFRGLYHQGYELGLAFTTSRLKSLPDILAILLRVGEDGRSWVPGLSDYDLTLLTERFDPPRTIQFLEELWASYRRIKKSVPQLGETEVMNLEEYVDFLSFGPMPTASLKRTDPLFVRPGSAVINNTVQRIRRVPGEREFLLDALSRYILFFFPAWLHHATESSHFARSRAEHLLDNVVKRLRYLGVSDVTTDSETFADKIHHVFEDLSRVCSKVPPYRDNAAAVISVETWVPVESAVPAVMAFCSEALRQAKVNDCSVILWISYMSADKLNLVFVVPDETPRNELWKLVATLGILRRESEDLWQRFFFNGELQAFFPAFYYPIVISRSMWRSWRDLSPFNGAAVAANGRTLMGPEDDLRNLPSMAALKRGAEVQYAALLPLKNNWRPLQGSGTSGLYGMMMNHVQGYSSANTGKILTSPTTHNFKSTQDGYRAVCEELQILRKGLTA